ncbi:glycosyltransferase family 8 protein [Micromonospora schwarzwaldensis]|uniref:glycosyltransferase family 8 protein n=1 Tax=Micromonospora sp. DSM 45708 TaxID=3111767 RepID=UPI0031DDD235
METFDNVALVWATDDNYALPAAVSGRSLLANLPDTVRPTMYVLDLGISPRSRDLIAASWSSAASVEFLPLDEALLRDLPSTRCENREFAPTVFAYLLVPGMLSGRHRRMLYLDADTLVVGDARPLADLPLGEHAFGAVHDWDFGAEAQVFGQQHAGRQLNAGVLAIDVERWEALDATRRVFDFARGRTDLMLPDQDSLNVALGGHWQELSYEWNFQVARTVVREHRGPLPRILHYGGARKPWLGRSALPHFFRLYQGYARMTAFDTTAMPARAYPGWWEDDGR